MYPHRFVCLGCLNLSFLLIRVAYLLAYATVADFARGDVMCAMGHAHDLDLIWRDLTYITHGRGNPCLNTSSSIPRDPMTGR